MSRTRLPNRRESWTQKLSVGGVTVHLGCSNFVDGQPCEIFINTDLGADDQLRGGLHCLAIAVSVGLQHGVPFDTFVRLFTGTRFGPSGPIVGGSVNGIASSLVDAIFRELEAHVAESSEVGAS